jgi:hypothetical protein
MWIRDVDLPEPLIEAHRTGELVIFVGAGASLDPPSGLPDFRALAAGIAADAQIRDVDDQDLDRPDVFLGQLADDRGVDVHSRVAAVLGDPSSKPNRLHRTLVGVSASRPPVRIVTTNYDAHLSSVLADLDLHVPAYVGPALPMGDDFNGLVQLHGSVRHDARHLVVTDRDFGRAYLRDAWATRFLERMFARYTVVFVGYSHRDVVMQYLGRALGRSAAPRFVLTSSPDTPDWRRLNIQPIGYRLEGESHESLIVAIEGWASWASMGLLEHRQRAAELLSAPPSQVPEEASYLETLLADQEKVRLFTEFARGKEWLTWAGAQPEFRRLFDPTVPPTECTGPLAYWFAEHFVMVEEMTDLALGLLQDAGGRLGTTLWSAIGHELHRAEKPRPVFLGRWLMLLTHNDPDIRQDWLEYALVASQFPGDRPVALRLFDHLTEPKIGLQSSFGLSEAPRFDIRIRGDTYWVREAWQKLFSPSLSEVASDVLVIADHHLRRAHELLAAAGAAGHGWDPLSFGRSAIEPHSQDSIDHPVDVLIDAARDCLEALLAAGDVLADGYLDAWSNSEVPLLRRLALHGWVHRKDLDGTSKLMLLRERGWLFDHQLRHEVFRLIAVALPDADTKVADELVAAAVAGPQDVDDEKDRTYERFNALVWITSHAPDLATAREALGTLRSGHPEFQERSYPDLTSWTEEGLAEHELPMAVEEIHTKIEADAADAIRELHRYEDATSPFQGPSWDDALSLLSQDVRDNPLDGIAVLEAESAVHRDIVGAVIRGWSDAALEPDVVERILVVLAGVDRSNVADELSRLLSDSGRDEKGISMWHRLPHAREIAMRLWEVLPEGHIDEQERDPLGRAINGPAGRIALFWVHAISADWREAGEDWAGLPREIRAPLEAILEGQGIRTAMAEVVFASQVLFFFGADQDWCQLHVLPLLDWVDPPRARRAWGGFLIWGRWSDRLLAAGLLEHYLEAVRHIADFPDEPRRQLAAHLAGVALTSEVDPLPWVRKFTVDAQLRDRTEWIHQIDWLLDRLPSEAVEHQWIRWMRQYWQERLDSIPTQMTVEESSAMAEWVVHLTESVEDGVSLAMAHPAALEEHGDLLHYLEDQRLDHAAASFARLLAHLLRGTSPPFWGGHYLAQVVPRLRAGQADRADIRSIVEEALRLGYTDAPNW